MNFKYSVVCIIGLSVALIGCGGSPEVNPRNCSGKGLEASLEYFKDSEAERKAFLEQCEALGAEN
jgi:entry exclusion lipoprotein TrbK